MFIGVKLYIEAPAYPSCFSE